MKSLFNDNWYFFRDKADTPEGDFTTGDYKPVAIPHDFLIHDSYNLYLTSFGRYKKSYNFGDVENKSVRLYFEGVYMDCTVFVNGKAAFDWKYGYSSFETDITEYLNNGENEIAVLVRHRAPNTRWYSGAGIFRDIWLIETEKSYLATDGVYFHTEKKGDNFDVTLSCETVNADFMEVEFTLSKGDTVLYSGKAKADNPKVEFSVPAKPEYIWDIDSPNLLTLKTALLDNGREIDCDIQRVGLKEAIFDSDTGFYLNGRHIKLNGVCLHHDLGCLGAAFNKSAARRQLMKMKEMGVNSIRTSHNMPAKEFMNLCDEIGLTVNSEAFDMWERPKTEFDYARFFDDWYKKDVASWIRRDRNHVSVIMWSVGNEIYDTHVSPRGVEVSRMLHTAVRESDPLCNASTTIGSNYMAWEGAQNCAKEVDLAGYNYLERIYMEHHEKYPHWKIYGSETTAGVKSRGVYHFPRSAAFLTHDDMQCSSLGNCRAGESAQTAQDIIALNRDIDVCAGMYIWTGSDYIGEPSPYSTKNSYYGSIDTAGIKKDSYYLYKAAWTNEPVLHLFPYWDFNEGQLIDVVAFTNLPEVELFVNGKSAGVCKTKEYTVSWTVPYEKGEITVKAFDGDKEYTDTRCSFEDSAKIKLTPEKTVINADGEDIAVIIASTVDKNGNPVENAKDRINVKVTGGRLIGFDNGDSTDYDSYKSVSRKLFSGKGAIYVASDINEGDITVTASSSGLESATVTIKAVKSEIRKGVSLVSCITENEPVEEKPVRNIELKKSVPMVITPENKEFSISAVIYPFDTDYKDVKFSVITNSGIETNIANLTQNGLEASITVIGDGEFRVRCVAYNNKPWPEVISEYEFKAEGFGQAQLCPYEFIPGCLYNDSISKMDEVQKGGVNIKPHNNIVGFTKTDFGKYGTDEFLIRVINWHKDDPFTFELWLGYPDKDGSQLIGEYTYQADFEWQTYKDNHYKLPYTLKGLQDIYFKFQKTDMRIDFGGFSFTPNLKAYSFIAAADNDLLHGDTFKTEGTSVHGIGNNVFIDFNDLDLKKGAKAIVLYGKTRHDNDSVHVHFVLPDKSVMPYIIEFPFSKESTSVTLPIPDIRENCTVKFSFLPGCDFDFDGFTIIPNE